MAEGRFEEAERRLEQALAETPADAGLRMRYAEVLAETGRLEAALSEVRRSVDLDRLWAPRHVELGGIYLVARQYDAAIESVERALELDPQYLGAGASVLSNAYHWSGNDAAALEAAVHGLPAEIEDAIRRGYDAGGYEGMVRAAVALNLAQDGNPCTVVPELGAHWYALIGESDQMYECIDEAIAKGFLSLYLKVHPNWDPYRDDPRFTALLRRMGLEE
jgi:serine/threonine-protein kinase